MQTEPTFRVYEINPRRAQRGAEAVRMEVHYPDGSIDLLWMSERDIRRNMMAFGPCAELDKALAAYRAGIDGPRRGPVADGSQTPNDAAAIPCAKAGSNTAGVKTLPGEQAK